VRLGKLPRQGTCRTSAGELCVGNGWGNGMQERSLSLRNPVVAATLVALFGIWAVALWAWLKPGSSTAPISALTSVGTRIPSINNQTDRDTQAPPAPQPPVRTAATTDTDTPAPPASQPTPVTSKTANGHVPALSAPQSPLINATPAINRAPAPARTTLPDIVPGVVRGNQAAMTSEAASVGNTAVVRGTQEPAALMPPDGAPAVVRGIRAPSPSGSPAP
jgi:hypothetical protein